MHAAILGEFLTSRAAVSFMTGKLSAASIQPPPLAINVRCGFDKQPTAS